MGRRLDRESWRESWLERARRGPDRWFPERQVVLRTEGRVSYLRISQRFQIISLFVLLAAVAWTMHASVGYVLHGHILAEREARILEARLAYTSLLHEVADYQRKFIGITRDLEKNHSAMLDLVEQNAALKSNLQTVESQLHNAEQDRAAVASAREVLKGQLQDIEDRMAELTGRNFTLRGSLETVSADLETLASERNRAVSEREEMRQTIVELEGRINEMEETESDAVQRLTDSTNAAIETWERVIGATGLDPRQLVATVVGDGDGGTEAENGQGGPFFAVTDGDKPGSRLQMDLAVLDARLRHWEALQDTMGRMPFTAPLNSYHISSSYGKRRDPLNKKWAMHYGLDLGAPLKAPVFATASGTVTFAGWKGKYGKLVEIDHGGGLVTRYGHLHKFLVKKGQTVKFRDRIGLLGNTGRSTGAHLHYEVAFKGRTRNPIMFIKAGRDVFKE